MIEFLAFLYTESPLHAGASDSIGMIDLPIQREAHTGYPVVWGQSLKGVLRQTAAASWEDPSDVTAVFGSAVSPGQPTSPGLLSVGDAQLIAMPVPTLTRTFAWATSALALGRLARKYKVSGYGPVPAVPTDPAGPVGAVSVAEHWKGEQALGPLVIRTDTEPQGQKDLMQQWSTRIGGDAFGSDQVFRHFREKFATDLLLVDSDAMRTLVEECTEVTTRVHLDEGKTVKNGPYHSEYLPTETLLAVSLTLRFSPAGETETQRYSGLVRRLLHGDGATLLRIGGHETLGKGLVWCRLVQTETGENA